MEKQEQEKCLDETDGKYIKPSDRSVSIPLACVVKYGGTRKLLATSEVSTLSVLPLYSVLPSFPMTLASLRSE